MPVYRRAYDASQDGSCKFLLRGSRIAVFDCISLCAQHRSVVFTVAALLGASALQKYSRIILPLISGGIALSMSMTFLLSVSEYFATFLIGGGNVLTLSGLLYPYVSNFDLQNAAILCGVFLLIHLTVFFVASAFVKKRSYLY